MKTYNILATHDFQIPHSVRSVATYESDYGEYTEDPYQSVRVTIPDNYATIFELALNADDNVSAYDEISDPRDEL
jgi:hypothetical protein